MDYGKVLGRSWNIIWQHKFLILIGMLVALGSGLGSSLSSGTGSLVSWNGDGYGTYGQPGEWGGSGVPLAAALLLGGLGLIVALAIWVLSTIARGSLIAGAAAVDGEGSSTFGEAWAAGWRRGWALLGIGILPAIPGLVLALGGLGAFLLTSGVVDGTASTAGNASLALVGILGCIGVPLILVLELVRTFADRACVLEGMGVLDSYGRGFRVLGQNLGSAIILFLLQVAVSLVLGVVLIVPGIIMALCCLFWPVLLVFEGIMAAFFSTMWTLAWREWTGMAPVEGSVLGM